MTPSRESAPPAASPPRDNPEPPAAQLSAIVDGEAEAGAIDATLRLLAASPEAREAVTLFQAVGDAMRGRAVEDDGFSQRIFAALDKVAIER